MLWLGTAASLLSLGINGWLDTLSGMWLSIVPLALLNQNFSVAKALVSDYIDEQGGSDAERAGAVGKLGMALGFSFMAGPLLATLLVKSYTQALRLSAIGILSAVLLLMPPAPAGAQACRQRHQRRQRQRPRHGGRRSRRRRMAPKPG